MKQQEPSLQVDLECRESDIYCSDNFIDGKWSASQSQKRFDVVDPGSGKIWASPPDSVAADVETAIQSAHKAFQTYSREVPRKRAELILAWHQLILAHKEDLARILVHETGKPLSEAYDEITYATTFTWWFMGEAERIQGSNIKSATPGRRAFVIKQPIGPVAALVPWNFPIALCLRKASAALAAGCTMVVKPSPETPITALCLASLALKAGFPPGVLNVVTTSLENTPRVSEAMCTHPLIKKVSFTGSTRVGKLIAGLCSRSLKKSTLELGGNCPFIVFEDADLASAASQLSALKWRHAGQACITANRVFVQRAIYKEFVAKVVAKASGFVVGHGMNRESTMGPVTTRRSLIKAEELATDAVAKGAKIILGSGKPAGRAGFFMEPTVLTGVQDNMLMSVEEIFAPVLGISVFDTEEEVVKRANNTSLGLASYVFTQDADRLWRTLENLEAGMIGLNTGGSSAAEAPFGGIKESGWGKESGKDVALDEFMVTKTGTLTVKGHC
ncbi:succinate-semialdehyde dehydrogenase [Exophiala aquamarina CBS 119918]|uniref:Succinate-semialdehyde dehydrogenase n=1 Tax=Exophiala aquamarina CBS 119918 TaxID=1182545 RepID=A0A072NVF3_9EURO|nr:succinate-semialdehyde dehydrogenase [Exophiala aquamarina CBS 119918]KEF51834.1 succinate-semialdehyde dehydrogenase [Exophiala aquamarina CBS 119918]